MCFGGVVVGFSRFVVGFGQGCCRRNALTPLYLRGSVVEVVGFYI
nr:MAG TPA: hypothetical protein [Caudoviricetes sp.]